MLKSDIDINHKLQKKHQVNEHISFKNASSANQPFISRTEYLQFRLLFCICALQSKDKAGKGHVAIKGAVGFWYLFGSCVLFKFRFSF
jgi:hypothetical protein